MGVACCEAESDLRPINADGTKELGQIGKPQPIVVEYFGAGYGRADVLMQMLEHKKANYRFQEVTQEEWASRKPANQAGEFSCLPIVKKDGKEI